MEREFLQEKSLNRLQSNAEKSLNVDLSAKSRLIPYSDAADMLSLNNLYVEERDACENYRMIFTVNPVCSNVLFNAVTEPVFMEGSDSAICITMSPVERTNQNIFPEGVFNQSGNTVDQIAAIRDTEFSHERIGNFKYHCGYDIFNNHLLRTDDFEHVQLANDDFNKDEFNTIFDYAVDYSGNVVTRVIGESEGPLTGKPQEEKIRMYELDNIKSFNTAFYDGVRNTDGWYGFYNFGYINIPNGELNGKSVSINKVINNEPGCSFIDFYPDRTLYSFIPKVNRYRKRLERNWDCTIVYPYENDYDMFNKVMDPYNREPNAVRVLEAKVTYDNVGNEIIEMHSLLRHTLQAGDTIRLFYAKNEEEIVRYDVPVRVISVGDTEGKEKDRCFLVKYYDFSSICSIDDLPNTTFFYRKIEGGYDDKYYFRKFKELRNYEYIQCDETSEAVSVIKAPEVINDESPKYIKLGNDYFEKFEKPLAYTQNKLAYGENIYGDRIAQVIFTDDICTAGLLDNLGRPLSSVYFTAVKTNKGHKEWYENQDAKSEKVEYSHCFGDVTSGIDLPSGITNYNVRELYNVQRGGAADVILEEAPTGTSIYGTPLWLESGITLDNDSVNTFYGDIVEFSKTNFTETVLEQVYHRFNTAQRETLNSVFANINYDELVSDQYEVGEVGGETPPAPPQPEEEGIEVAFQVMGGFVADAIAFSAYTSGGDLMSAETAYDVTEWNIRWFKPGDRIEWSVSATGIDITGYVIQDCHSTRSTSTPSTTITDCNMLIQIGMEVTPTYEYSARFWVADGFTADTIDYKVNNLQVKTISNVSGYRNLSEEFNLGDLITYSAKSAGYYDTVGEGTITLPAPDYNDIGPISFTADYGDYKILFTVSAPGTFVPNADEITYSAYCGSSEDIRQTGLNNNVQTWTITNREVADEEHYFRPGDIVKWTAKKDGYLPAEGQTTITNLTTTIRIEFARDLYTFTLVVSGGMYASTLQVKTGTTALFPQYEYEDVSAVTISRIPVNTPISYSATCSGQTNYILPGSKQYDDVSYWCKNIVSSVTITESEIKNVSGSIVFEVEKIGGNVTIGPYPYDASDWQYGYHSVYLSGLSNFLASKNITGQRDYGVLPFQMPVSAVTSTPQLIDNNLRTTLSDILNITTAFTFDGPDGVKGTFEDRFDIYLTGTNNGEFDGYYKSNVYSPTGTGIEMTVGDFCYSRWEPTEAGKNLEIKLTKQTYDNTTFKDIKVRLELYNRRVDNDIDFATIGPNDDTVTAIYHIPNSISSETHFVLTVYNNGDNGGQTNPGPQWWPAKFKTITSNNDLNVTNLSFNELQNNYVYLYGKKSITVTVKHSFPGEVLISRTTPTQSHGSGIGTLVFNAGTQTQTATTDTGGQYDYISSSGWTTPFHIGFNYNGTSPTWSEYSLTVVVHPGTSEERVVYSPDLGTGYTVDNAILANEGGFDLTYEDLDGSVWTFTP